MMADTKSTRLNYLSLLTKSPCSFKRTILAGEVKSLGNLHLVELVHTYSNVETGLV